MVESTEDASDRPGQPPQAHARITAAIEVFLCSGFPTQILLAMGMAAVGFGIIGPDGQLSLPGVVTLLLGNAVIVLCFVFYFLKQHGERAWDVFVGTRSLVGELRLGIFLFPLVLAMATISITVLHWLWPDLRSVPQNPFEALLQSPVDAVTFATVAVVAGAIGEELQRAFVLRRFEQQLGGGLVGLVVFSILFGLGHVMQGWDAAIATGLLGLFWGVMYLRRHSAVPAMVSHAGFNLAQIAIALSGPGMSPP